MKPSYPVRLTFEKRRLFERIGYEPSAGQREFHDSPARYRLLCAGARFGKSLAAAMECVCYLVPDGVRVWLAAPNYDLAEKEFRYVVDAVLKLGLPIDRMNDNKRSGDLMLRLRNGSMIEAKSCDSPTSLLGEEVDLLVLCEGSQITRNVYLRYLRARIGSRVGRVVVPTTPSGVDDFIYPLFYLPAERGEDGYWCGQYATADNPHHDRNDIEEARRYYTEIGNLDEFLEQYEGRFVSFSGKVFKDFRRATHVTPPFEVPGRWLRFRAIDPGYEDPFCCLWFAVDEEGTIWVYREHYLRRAILSVHAKAILRADGREAVRYTVIDPSAKAARVDSGIPLTSQLAELGVPTIPGWNRDRQTRAWRVMEYLRVDPASGKPKLMFFDSCPNAIREMEAFSYKQSKEGHNTNDEMQDRDDHAVDCVSMFCMTRPPRPRTEEKVDPRSFRRYDELMKRYAGRPNVIGSDRDGPRGAMAW